jgi:hypothetical protein
MGGLKCLSQFVFNRFDDSHAMMLDPITQNSNGHFAGPILYTGGDNAARERLNAMLQ